jgi:uncharacterized membrane protein
MIVPRANTIELEMSVEAALKHIVSMGSVPPTSSTGLPVIGPNHHL